MRIRKRIRLKQSFRKEKKDNSDCRLSRRTAYNVIGLLNVNKTAKFVILVMVTGTRNEMIMR